jgi:hypothetical protein
MINDLLRMKQVLTNLKHRGQMNGIYVATLASVSLMSI